MQHNCNLEIFRTKNEIFYYLLGALLTDGNIFISGHCNKIQMTSKDADWLLLIQQLIGCAIYPTKDGHGNLSINSKEICGILLDSGCAPNKSLLVRLPHIPNEYLPDLIRGCMDGDGSIPNGKRIQCYICSSNIEFLQDIKTIIDTKNITSHIYKIKKTPYTLKNGKTITPKNKHYRLMITGGAAKKFLTWIYYPNHKLSMPRKNSRAQQIINKSFRL
jgi:hypothetical protein